MKSYLSSIVLLAIASVLAPQQTSNVTSVPVEDEPLHKVVFKNDVVTVIHVLLAPGQTTLFHSHTHDRIAIDLSSAAIAQQKINEPETAPTQTKPGNISSLTLTEASYTHRVRNTGTTPYEVLDIEPAQRPASRGQRLPNRSRGPGGLLPRERGAALVGGTTCRQCPRRRPFPPGITVSAQPPHIP